MTDPTLPAPPTPAWTDLVCARVLHDLVGPVGAIGNGVELLEELGPSADALGLIGDSARQTADRLKLFRLAYGAGGYANAATVPALWALLTPVLAEKRLAADPLPAMPGGHLPDALGRPGVAKTLALATVALADTALRGGRVACDPTPGESICSLTLTAERTAPDALAGFDIRAKRPTVERAVPARLAQEVAAGLGLLWTVHDNSRPLRLDLRADSARAADFIAAI